MKVPFAEKDEAKALGARWGPQAKVWYVPEGNETAPTLRQPLSEAVHGDGALWAC
nr:DUF5710 domain-containing protein [Stutzerimonas stutzeri]